MSLPPHITPILQASANGLQNTGATVRDTIAPELLGAINTCTPEPLFPKPSAIDGPKAVLEILAHISRRLQAGLDEVWSSPDCHESAWTDIYANDADQLDVDEKWARCCTELMAGITYGSFQNYNAIISDSKGFEWFESETNPVVPIAMACQQLCSYALMVRGYSKLAINGGVNAGINSHLNPLFMGNWSNDPSLMRVDAGFRRPAGAVTPGSLYGFSPGHPHVAFVLRTAPTSSKLQLFDTGGISQLPRSAHAMHVMSRVQGKGLYENALLSGKVAMSDSTFAGLGVLKRPEPSVIREGIAKAYLARPLGFVRFAIFRDPRGSDTADRETTSKIDPKDILYVSQRLPMHDLHSDANFYVSRYLWALRDTPNHSSLRVLVEFSAPFLCWAQAMRNTARTEPPKDVILRCNHPGGHPQTMPFIWYATTESGHVKCVGRYKDQPTQEDGKWISRFMFDPDPMGTATPRKDDALRYRKLLARYTEILDRFKSLPMGKSESAWDMDDEDASRGFAPSDLRYFSGE